MVKASVEKETPKKARVVKKKVEATPAPAPVVEAESAEPPAAPTQEAEAESSLNDQFNEFMAKLHQLGAQFTSLKSEFKALEKRCTKEVKAAQKASAKKKASPR